MTKERMEEISRVLMANESQIPTLMAMEPANAAAKLTELGCECTAEELVAYSKALNEFNASAELDENDLDNVAGGAIVATFLAGVCVGYLVYNKVW